MKIFCLNSKPYKIAAVCILACMMLCSALFITKSQTVFFGYAARKLPIYSVDTNEKKIAITFDAAWGADKTEEIIKICQEKNIEATFFLVGFWVEKYPDLVKKIDEANIFDIGTHSNTHPNMGGLSEEQMRNELTTSVKLIEDITQKKVKYFRPPYGDYSDRLITVCEDLGLQAIQWSVDSLDWKGLSAGEMLQRITSTVQNGSIILCHNNSDHIVEALPVMIDTLRAQGYTFVKMSNLVYAPGSKIDNNGTQYNTIA